MNITPEQVQELSKDHNIYTLKDEINVHLLKIEKMILKTIKEDRKNCCTYKIGFENDLAFSPNQKILVAGLVHKALRPNWVIDELDFTDHTNLSFNIWW